MAAQCEACKGSITVTQKRIKCIICLHLYHSDCINYKNESLSRSQWKCPNCVASQRKGGDNSNTPIRAKSTLQDEDNNTKSSLPSTPVDKLLQPGTSKAVGGGFDCGVEKDFVSQMESLLDSKLQAVKTELVCELKASFANEIRNELAAALSGFSLLEESHNNLLKEHDILKNEHEALQVRVLNSESQLLELRGQIGRQQQWARICNIEIVGLPETTNESPIELVTKIAKHAGVQIKPEEIESAHRVQPMQKVEGRPKPLVVKFRSRMSKDQIISGLRKTRGICTGDIGLKGSNKNFFVNEHLTPENKHLLKLAKTRGQEKSYKFVWVRNCSIFLRKNEESPCVAINTEKDLLKIV